MVTATSIRSKLDTKVFGKLGSTALISYTTQNSSYGGYNPTTATVSGTALITVVPFNSPNQVFNKSAFGTLKEGESSMILKWNQTVSAGDVVEWKGTQYEVVRVESFDLDNGVIAQEALLTKLLA